MAAKLWPILFHVCWLAASTLLPLAVHLIAHNDGTLPVWQQVLGILIGGPTGVTAAFGALVAHHKTVAQKAAEVPEVAKTGARLPLINNLWNEYGVDATPEQIAALKTLKGQS